MVVWKKVLLHSLLKGREEVQEAFIFPSNECSHVEGKEKVLEIVTGTECNLV